MMQVVFDKLRTLQAILTKKYEIEKEIHDIPKVLNTKNELLNRLKKSYIDKNKQIEESKERTRRIRIRLEDAEKQREDYEKQMDLISTQREYEALDKEIKDATEKEQQFRKDLLREEKELDELIQALEREENMIKLQEEELKAEQEKIEAEKSDRQTALEELKKEEEITVPDLDQEIVFKFERIIKSKAGRGIVPVKNSVCTGCYMMLPAQFQNEVRQGEKILFCPYCSRILYYADEESEDVFFQEEDSGSLADLVDMDAFNMEE